MKKSKFTPKRFIDGFVMKHQQKGGYKIVEYSHIPLGIANSKKRTIKRDLDQSTAEAELYKLETKYKL